MIHQSGKSECFLFSLEFYIFSKFKISELKKRIPYQLIFSDAEQNQTDDKMSLESSPAADCKECTHLHIELKKAHKRIAALEESLQLREQTLMQSKQMITSMLSLLNSPESATGTLKDRQQKRTATPPQNGTPAKQSKEITLASSEGGSDDCMICSKQMPVKLTIDNSVKCHTCNGVVHANCAHWRYSVYICPNCDSDDDMK